MSNDNFIKLTRLLSTDQNWVDARPTHQSVLICILLRMAFADTEQNNDGRRVTIKKCQLYVSIRKLAEWSSRWITRDDVVGALKYFSGCKFLLQEVRHGKSLITITQPDICKQFLAINPTKSPTKVRQESDTKEEREEEKLASDSNSFEGEGTKAKDSSKGTSDNVRHVIHFSRETSEFIGITQADRDAWQKVYPQLNLDLELLEMRTWLLSTPKGKKRHGTRSFVDKWLKLSETNRMSNPPKMVDPEPNGAEIDPFLKEYTKRRTYEG